MADGWFHVFITVYDLFGVRFALDACSNLTFQPATMTCLLHYVAQLLLVLFLYNEDYPVDFVKLLRPFVFIVICVASCFLMEYRLRSDFASRCEINLEQERERELLDSSKYIQILSALWNKWSVVSLIIFLCCCGVCFSVLVLDNSAPARGWCAAHELQQA